MTRTSAPRAAASRLAAGLSLASWPVPVRSAQTRFSYSSGQPLEPAYEGWMQNPDGSYTMFFGYMNTNWLQEFDIPVGPDNRFEPGNPTTWASRRTSIRAAIRSCSPFTVPKDFGTKELVWTLTANGQTRKVYASLKTDYNIDKQVISTEVGGDNGSLADELRTNEPPDLAVEGPKTRTVKVGQPLALAAIAGDPDNLPARRDGKPQPGVKKATATASRAAAARAPAAAEQRRGGLSAAGRGGGVEPDPGLHFVVDRVSRRGRGA